LATKCVAVIEGDDAAPEAVRPTVDLLRSMGLDLELTRVPTGVEAQQRLGSGFPEESRRAVDASDAVLFGATSGASAEALFYLRWGKRTFANVRPVRWSSGFASPLARPEGIDMAIVRENLEDLYMGLEGDLGDLAPLNLVAPLLRRPLAELGPGRFAIKVITEEGTERVARFACELALARQQRGRPGKVTCGTKHNMLFRSDGLFRQIVTDVVAGYPSLQFESFIVDDLARRLVADPQSFDVVVLPNLYGDILSDETAGLVGGLGLAPSGCYGEGFAYFESVHGSAPDIAGKHIINPTATILSAAMMLEYLGFAEEAARLEAAVRRIYEAGEPLTPDQGGTATTEEFCEAVRANMQAEAGG